MILAALLRRASPGILLVVAFCSPAFAQGGINLSWNDCGSFGVFARSFACDTNSGQEVLFGSAVSGVDLPQVNAMYAVIDLQTNQAALSNWWYLGAGGCRQGALAADFSFAPAMVNCFDPWNGAASGGTTYEARFQGTNQARIRVFCTIATTAINGIDEYYLFKLALSHDRSTGTGSCGGCANAACIELRLIQLSDARLGDLTFVNPLLRHFVQFQPPFGDNCPPVDQLPDPDAARNATWGAVKSLYR